MPNTTVNIDVPAEEAWLTATVIRCGCGDPARIHPASPCPTPRAVEDRGTVSYYHRNPLRRWAWEIRRAWREGRGK